MTAKSSTNKKSKKRRHDAERQDEPSPEPKSAKKEKKHKSQDKKLCKEEKKAAKKQVEEELLAKIPKVDEDGIPYNKIQIRRMKRRVKHGLDPIPTEEEEKEIAKRKEEEKKEVEELFADREKDKLLSEDEVEDGEGGSDGEESHDDPDDEGADDRDKPTHQQQPIYKKARTKPVPPDYVCSACQNKSSQDGEFSPHWIYDCPSKVTKKGCNTKSKKTRGLTDPPSRKVFVSGLPFDVTERGVKQYFDTAGEVVHVKLLKFEDSQRCKGQGILTFDTDAGAKAALKLNGEIWVEEEEPVKKKKKKSVESTAKEKKELRLKVSKVLNRFVTKKQKKG
ncbi:hypothetical protein ACHAWO_013842 [Cyclotella atomus]|jgi:hypothetical protein|uniref:RRM domain-containing protein n=1 Tax=Cyclotella atomus TaxID=382360 RepID=A0ABD3QIT4_9STRA